MKCAATPADALFDDNQPVQWMDWLWIWFLTLLFVVAAALTAALAYACRTRRRLDRHVKRIRVEYLTLQAQLRQAECPRSGSALMRSETELATRKGTDGLQSRRRLDPERSVRFGEVLQVDAPVLETSGDDGTPLSTPPTVQSPVVIAVAHNHSGTASRPLPASAPPALGTASPDPPATGWSSWLRGLLVSDTPAALPDEPADSPVALTDNSPRLADKAPKAVLRSSSCITDTAFYSVNSMEAASDGHAATADLQSAQGEDDALENDETDAFIDCVPSEVTSEPEHERSLFFRLVVAAEDNEGHRVASDGALGTTQFLHLCEELGNVLEELGRLSGLFRLLAKEIQARTDALQKVFVTTGWLRLAAFVDQETPTTPPSSMTTADCVDHLTHILTFFEALVAGLLNPAANGPAVLTAALDAHLTCVLPDLPRDQLRTAPSREAILDRLAPSALEALQCGRRFSTAVQPTVAALQALGGGGAGPTSFTPPTPA
eukprot:EG_transcript_9172